jgi:hypothetical protein
MRLLPLLVLFAAPACAGAQSAVQSESRNAVEAASEAALLHSSTPLSLRRDQADYLRERGETTETEFVESLDEARLERLVRAAEIDRKAKGASATLATLPQGCLDIGGVDGCGATEGGWLTGPNGARLFWQIQSGSTGEDGITGGVVLMVETGGRLSPVVWAFQGSGYEAPVLFDADGELYVGVPGRTFGAGRGDADLIFRWTPGAAHLLTQIDSWSWRDQLARRLPGLNAFGRVRIDYREMIASTPMFRDGDPGCCGTGGQGLIDFAIEGDRLAVADARVDDPLLGAAMTVPVEVFDWMGRKQLCDHWMGEEGYDAERRAQIANAAHELRCEAEPADGAALRVKYADNRDVSALIDRVAADR